MDEEQTPREENGLLDWTPPELLERARTAAERDEQSARRIAAHGTHARRMRKPGAPIREHRGAAIALCLLCLGLQIAGGAAGIPEQRARGGAPGLAVFLLLAAVSLLFYLFYLLPQPRKKHRAYLIALSLAGLAGSVAQGVAAARGTAVPVAMSVLSVLFALLLSPLPWLLRDAVRRRSSRTAGVMAFVSILMSLLNLAAAAGSAKTTGKPPAAPLTASVALSLVQNTLFGALLLLWPVAEKAILGQSEPEEREEEAHE